MKKNNKRPTSYKAKPKRKTRRGITAENYRERMAEVEELSPLFEHCRKGGGQ